MINEFLTETILQLIRTLDLQSVINLCSVNKRYKDICNDDYVVKSLFRRSLPKEILLPDNIILNLTTLKLYLNAFKILDNFISSKDTKHLSLFDSFDLNEITKNAIDLFIYNLKKQIFTITIYDQNNYLKNLQDNDTNPKKDIIRENFMYLIRALIKNTNLDDDIYTDIILHMIESNYPTHDICEILDNALMNEKNLFKVFNEIELSEYDSDDTIEYNIIMQLLHKKRYAILDHIKSNKIIKLNIENLETSLEIVKSSLEEDLDDLNDIEKKEAIIKINYINDLLE